MSDTQKRLDGTIFTMDHIAYINSVIEKLNNLTQKQIKELTVPDDSEVVKAYYDTEFADTAYINTIPAYIPNKAAFLKNIQETTKTLKYSFNLTGDSETHSRFFKAPKGYSGNYAFVKLMVRDFTDVWKSNPTKFQIQTASSTRPYGMEYITAMVKSGTVKINIAQQDSGILLSHFVDEDTTWYNDIYLEALQFYLEITYFKYGVN